MSLPFPLFVFLIKIMVVASDAIRNQFLHVYKFLDVEMTL